VGCKLHDFRVDSFNSGWRVHPIMEKHAEFVFIRFGLVAPKVGAIDIEAPLADLLTVQHVAVDVWVVNVEERIVLLA